MAKFEDISTFNLDDKTYAVVDLNQESKDLLRVYLETEDDIVKCKIALVKAQHALNSMGIMFRDMIKDVPAVSAEQAAAAKLIEVQAANEAAAKPAAKKAPRRR